MKQGAFATKVVMLVLFAGVALYIGLYAAKRLSDPFVSTLAYLDTLDDAVETTGYLVRSETVLPGGAAIMDILPEEGERVGAGQTVAVLYQNSDALERKTEMESLELELEQLQYALTSGSGLEDAAKLENQIISTLLLLRAGSASGNLSGLDSEAMALRTRVLQQSFAYESTADSVAALQAAVNDLEGRLLTLRAQTSYDTTSLTAPYAGLFSGQVDGFESILTPEALDTLTAAQLTALSDGTSPEDSLAVGKLITGFRWYFACILDEASAGRLLPGGTVTVAFSRDLTQDIIMRVERVGKPEAEGCLVVFSSSRYLRDVTLLRRQTVDIVFRRYEGIHIPKQALRMAALTGKDPDTGEEYSYQVTGVYTVVGAEYEFKRVDIVREGSDYYLVKPSADVGSKLLRAGDEVIISARGIQDGKVILE